MSKKGKKKNRVTSSTGINLLKHRMKVKRLPSALLRYIMKMNKIMSFNIRAFAPIHIDTLPYFEKLSSFHQLDLLTELITRVMCNSSRTPFYADIHHQSMIITMLVFHLMLIQHEIENQILFEEGKQIKCHFFCDCEFSCDHKTCKCLSDNFDPEVIEICSLRSNMKFNDKIKETEDAKEMLHHFRRNSSNDEKLVKIKEEVNIRHVFRDFLKQKKKINKRVTKRRRKGKKPKNPFEEMSELCNDEETLEYLKLTTPFLPGGLAKLGIKTHPKAMKNKAKFTEYRKLLVELMKELWHPITKNIDEELCLYKDFIFWRELLILFTHEEFFEGEFRKKRDILREFRSLFMGLVTNDNIYERDRKIILRLLVDQETKKFEDNFKYENFTKDYCIKVLSIDETLFTIQQHLGMEKNKNKTCEEVVSGREVRFLYLRNASQLINLESETIKKKFDSMNELDKESGYETVLQIFKHPKQIRKSMKPHIFCTYCKKSEDYELNMSMKNSIIGEVVKGEKIKLRKCGSCKVAHYCSKSCQLKDWKKNHKLRCKKLKKERKKFNKRFETIESGQNYTHFPMKNQK